MRTELAFLLVILTAASATGGGQQASLRFDVASVKANGSNGPTSVRVGSQAGGGVALINVRLRDVILNAYRLEDVQLIGDPSWINTDHFDIIANGAGTPSPDEKYLMVRTLLAERFKLVVHREMRQLSVYALVVARRDGRMGPRLRRSRCSTAPASDALSAGEVACGGMRNGRGQLVVRGSGMAVLALGFSQIVGRSVLDRTGLSGRFDADLTWTPEEPPPAGSARIGATAPNGPSIFTAVREQLGLELEPTKAAVDVLVIDHVERPTPD